jgi:hypothetical protein
VGTVRKIETGAVVEPGYFTVIGLLAALGVTNEELRLLAPSAAASAWSIGFPGAPLPYRAGVERLMERRPR